MSIKLRALVTLLALALVAGACGDDDGGGSGFSSETRDAYMQGCVEDGNEAFCDCTLDELEKVFTEDEFEDFALNAAASGLEEPPEEFMTAITNCLDELDLGE
jgi:hypothetical protein